MLPRAIHSDPAELDSIEEVREFIGSLPDVLGETQADQLPVICNFQRNTHELSPYRAWGGGSATLMPPIGSFSATSTRSAVTEPA